MPYGDYQINGHVILNPTSGKWMPRRALDVQGDARPIYPGIHSFEMKWTLISHEEYSDLMYYFQQIEFTGTHTVRIPQYPITTGSAFGFQEYSGVTLAEPVMGGYFETFPQNVVLLITNIVVR